MSITFLRIVAVLAAVFAVPQAARSGEAHWPDTLTIGTGSPGGTYYEYGEGLAKLLTRKLDVSVFARATEGPTSDTCRSQPVRWSHCGSPFRSWEHPLCRREAIRR